MVMHDAELGGFGTPRRDRRQQRLVEIGDDIVDMLYTDREPDIAGGHAACQLILNTELRMCRARRMNCERTRIADIGHMIEEPECIDETRPCFTALLELEADNPAEAREVFFGAPSLFRILMQVGVDDTRDVRTVLQKAGDGTGVAAMLAHSQRQGLEALDKLEGVEWAHGHPEVAQQH